MRGLTEYSRLYWPINNSAAYFELFCTDAFMHYTQQMNATLVTFCATLADVLNIFFRFGKFLTFYISISTFFRSAKRERDALFRAGTVQHYVGWVAATFDAVLSFDHNQPTHIGTRNNFTVTTALQRSIFIHLTSARSRIINHGELNGLFCRNRKQHNRTTRQEFWIKKSVRSRDVPQTTPTLDNKTDIRRTLSCEMSVNSMLLQHGGCVPQAATGLGLGWLTLLSELCSCCSATADVIGGHYRNTARFFFYFHVLSCSCSLWNNNNNNNNSRAVFL